LQAVPQMVPFFSFRFTSNLGVRRYVEQAVFDAGRMDMSCLGGDCKATFNRSQLDRALPDAIKLKLDERKAEKDLEGIEGLDKCPFCPYAEFNENPDDSVLVCKNPDCGKESCRKCKEENHIPKRCEEVEKSSDTKKRLTIEEKMTEIRIRACHKCKTRFFKTEVCNKMTCRCGALMCYICREAIPANIGYGHFGQHVHEPGKSCEQCKKCVLFTNAEQDDLMAVEEARKLAEAETGCAGLVKATEVKPPAVAHAVAAPGLPGSSPATRTPSPSLLPCRFRCTAAAVVVGVAVAADFSSCTTMLWLPWQNKAKNVLQKRQAELGKWRVPIWTRTR